MSITQSPASGLSRKHDCGIVGVSLSNTVFNRAFFKALFHWSGEAWLRRVDVILFERLESINFQVFRGMDEAAAVHSAKRRGEDLRRMCERMAKVGVNKRFPLVRVLLESEALAEFFSQADYEGMVSVLEEAYLKRADFYSDVRRQVMTNLKRRAEVYGFSFISDNLDSLAEYIIREVAFFYLFFSQCSPDAIEIYPGENLFVKERLFKGEYEELPGYHISQALKFENVSFLAKAAS